MANPNNSLRIISLNRVGNPISATEMRELTVRENMGLTVDENDQKNLQEFKQKMESTGIPIADLENLFRQIQNEMQRENPITSRSRKSKKADTSNSTITSTKRSREEIKRTSSRKKGGKRLKSRKSYQNKGENQMSCKYKG